MAPDNTVAYVITGGLGDFEAVLDVTFLSTDGFLSSDEVAPSSGYWEGHYWPPRYWTGRYWPHGTVGIIGGDPGSPGGTDWFTTEIGRWVRGLSTQFNGNPTLVRWRDEAEAAAIAGAPYPWYTSELQRRFLDYFISIQ